MSRSGSSPVKGDGVDRVGEAAEIGGRAGIDRRRARRGQRVGHAALQLAGKTTLVFPAKALPVPVKPIAPASLLLLIVTSPVPLIAPDRGLSIVLKFVCRPSRS
jgi:hypothetical protein